MVTHKRLYGWFINQSMINIYWLFMIKAQMRALVVVQPLATCYLVSIQSTTDEPGGKANGIWYQDSVTASLGMVWPVDGSIKAS
jgi:hypothetical protein